MSIRAYYISVCEYVREYVLYRVRVYVCTVYACVSCQVHRTAESAASSSSGECLFFMEDSKRAVASRSRSPRDELISPL